MTADPTKPPTDPGAPHELDLNWRDAALVLALLLAGVLMLGLGVAILSEALSARDDLVLAAAVWTQALLLAGAVWIVVLWPRRAKLRAFGVRALNRDQLRFAIFLAVAMVVLGLGLELAVSAATGVDPTLEQARRLGLDRAGPVALALFGVGAVVLAPIGEEVVFRGVLLPWLRGLIGVWPAILVSGAVFAAAHLQLSAAPNLFVVGLALGWCAVRTTSLTGPILTHSIYNGIATGLYLAGH